MTATTIDRNTPALYKQRGTKVALGIAALIPAGAIVCLDPATGKAVNGANTVGFQVLGRAAHRADQAGGDTYVVVERGVFAYVASAALIAVAQANVGRKVYLVDNQTVGLATDASNLVVAGVLEDFNAASGEYFVTIGLHIPADSLVSPAGDGLTIMAIDGGYIFQIPDAAGTVNYDITLPEKFEVVDVVVIKKGGAGAGNTVQVKSTANAITDAIAVAVDTTVTRAGTIDDAFNIVTAGGILRAAHTRAAGNGQCMVIVHGFKRA